MKIDPEESSIAAHIIPGVYLSGISRGGGEGGGGVLRVLEHPPKAQRNTIQISNLTSTATVIWRQKY